MRAVATVALAIASLVGVGATAAIAATATQNVTIQNAALVSPYQITVTGTSTCTSLVVFSATVEEQNGASGMGGGTFSGSSSNWSVQVDNTGAVAFVKDKATVSVSTSCGDATRTILVNTT